MLNVLQLKFRDGREKEQWLILQEQHHPSFCINAQKYLLFYVCINLYCLKVWGGIRFVYVFERSLLCSPLKFDRKHGNIVTYYYNLKQLFSMRIYFNMYFFSCDAKLHFQHHYSRLQRHMIMCWFAQKYLLILSMLLNIFWKKIINQVYFNI